MKKTSSLIISALIFASLSIGFGSNAFAATTEITQVVPADKTQALPPQLYAPEDFFAATVEDIIQQGEEDTDGMKQKFQIVKLIVTSGKDNGKEITIRHGGQVSIDTNQLVKKGEKVVVAKTSGGGEDGGSGYYIADKYRLPPLLFAIIAFLALVIYFGRFKGFMSLIGLAFSVFILMKFILPLIIAGYSALLVTLIGSFVIAVVSIFLAHGFNKRTVISVFATLITLSIAIALAVLFVEIAHLFGGGSEEAAYLKLDPATNLNLQGLLLGGIIIGTLGVLDDITTAQVACVHELHEANRSLTAAELYRRGLTIGREHIASLVNTLVLAYAGASLPLFLMFTMNSVQPFWVTFNSEFIAEEVIRTLIGSMALVLGVPIATWLAARHLSKSKHKNA